jgi:hypothetical protein
MKHYARIVDGIAVEVVEVPETAPAAKIGKDGQPMVDERGHWVMEDAPFDFLAAHAKDIVWIACNARVEPGMSYDQRTKSFKKVEQK